MAEDDRAGLRAVAGVGIAGRVGGGEAGFTAAEGRRFGLAVGGAFLALGGLLFWRAHHVPAGVVAALGTALLGAGLAIPSRLGPLHRAWMGLALAISKVTTPLLMGAVYFLLITPTAWLRRTFGGDPLRHPPREGSYWHRRERGKGDLRRQF